MTWKRKIMGKRTQGRKQKSPIVKEIDLFESQSNESLPTFGQINQLLNSCYTYICLWLLKYPKLKNQTRTFFSYLN